MLMKAKHTLVVLYLPFRSNIGHPWIEEKNEKLKIIKKRVEFSCKNLIIVFLMS